MFEVEFYLMQGTNISVVQDILMKTGEYLKTIKGIESFSTYAGTSAPRYVLSASPEPIKSNFGMILVNTKNYKDVSKIVKEVQKYCDMTFPNASTIARKVPLRPPYDAPVKIRISG